MPERPDKPLILVPGPASAKKGLAGGTERRAAPRYPFTATAEISEPRSQTRIQGRTTDLGLGGCYVDTLSPIPQGTLVHLRLTHNLRQFETLATVANVHPPMGMGLSFSNIEPEHALVLHQWVAELSGEQAPQPPATPREPIAETPRVPPHVRQVLNDLINLMIRKRIINESEGMALLRELFR